jgi:hypothetical protein
VPQKRESYGHLSKPKENKTHNALNLSAKVKFLDLLEGSMSLAEVG